MSFDQLKVSDLRKAVRHFAPETRATGGLAHVGDKQQLIEFLQQRGVMPCEAQEYLAGAETIQAPEQDDQQHGIAAGYHVPEQGKDDFFGATPLDQAIQEVKEQYGQQEEQHPDQTKQKLVEELVVWKGISEDIRKKITA